MERKRLTQITNNEDITLAEISLNTTIVDIMYYVGNTSSIIFFPLIVELLEQLSPGFDMYKANAYIYAFDNVLNLDEHIYLVFPISSMKKRTHNNKETFFDCLKRNTSAYYYDKNNFVFAFRISKKYISDYYKIIESKFSAVSTDFKNKCTPGKISYALVHNSPVLKEEWNKVRSLLYNEKDINSGRAPEIITEERYFPPFLKERETYYAEK